MIETQIINFDFYVAGVRHDFQKELREKIESREEDGWEVTEVKIFQNKSRDDWYDIFLIMKRGK